MFYSGKFIGDERNAQDIKLAALAPGLVFHSASCENRERHKKCGKASF